jgi:6-phosphogluconate dehydrogenase
MTEAVGDIAVIGLAVMGQNLILNMNDHGYTVVAFNRTVSKVDDFLNNEAKGTKIVGAHSLEEMVKYAVIEFRVIKIFQTIETSTSYCFIGPSWNCCSKLYRQDCAVIG